MPGKANGVTPNGSSDRPFRTFDPDDPEYIKELQRPAAIKEDLSEMERRKRVQQILESKSFCKVLESLIKTESESCKNDPNHLETLQRLSELSLPHGQLAAASLHNIAVVPIADLRDNESYTKIEKVQRCRLASLYRLVDLFQWSQGIYNHITLRTASNASEILVNPFGLLYHEITASSLVKVDLDGNIIDSGSTKLGINQDGFIMHSIIHKARSDVNCVLHLHTAVVAAISSMKCGLLPLCKEAMIIGPVAYHDYQVLFNFLIIRPARAGIENLVIPDEKSVERVRKSLKRGSKIEWKVGELEWEAWMRVLDTAGFRTGHLYKQPLFRKPVTSAANEHNDVAEPPATTAMGTVDEMDLEALTAHKIAMLRKEQEKARWLNSPNAYQKVEFLETGTDNPKKITKWVQDSTSPKHNGTAVKIISPHQFSPVALNPKEFKEKQRAIKENRLTGATSAGPQSQILDGVSYEEMAQIRPSGMGQMDRVVMIGTASKGIIDRQHQHNAQVYRQLYAPNPFATETDEDIQKYIKEVEMKTPRPGSVTASEKPTRSSATEESEAESLAVGAYYGIIYFTMNICSAKDYLE
uniref:Aldolase_II domain-containing protein n=1 Tax=Syphacia muris TaxID=451379 RepID=A0A0N5B0F5_9BILA